MLDHVALVREFFEGLSAADAAIVARVAAAGCPYCGGVLHRGDFPRKPRGGAFSAFDGSFSRRFSLCCSRDGCRKRATPPSVRFLGRRVYVGAVVVVAALFALAIATASAATRMSGVPARTTRRWLRWWRGPFTESDVFVKVCAHIVPPPRASDLPASLVSKMTAPDISSRIVRVLVLLAPLTTASVGNGASFVRGTS
jgi:hypothetical protein